VNVWRTGQEWLLYYDQAGTLRNLGKENSYMKTIVSPFRLSVHSFFHGIFLLLELPVVKLDAPGAGHDIQAAK